MTYRIVTVTDRPDLAPTVARWRVEAFFDYPGGYTVEDMTTRILAPPIGPKETFVLLEDDRPVGTAGLVRADLKSRPDLTPWLAGVFVEPAFRGRGHASALVRAVEVLAAAASVSTIWLYTSKAEALYSKLGWKRVGFEPDRDETVMLMRRDLADEWRLGNTRHLAGLALHRRRYVQWSEAWDHDHCAACWAKFIEDASVPGSLQEGFATGSDYPKGAGYEWVCHDCFVDLACERGWTATS